MTINQAIKAIKAIKNNYPPAQYTMLREALKMAIEALECYKIGKKCDICLHTGKNYNDAPCQTCKDFELWESL